MVIMIEQQIITFGVYFMYMSTKTRPLYILAFNTNSSTTNSK